jgi:3'-phosphoadenosine 5'-phosphosulfate sulfotransferase (PAPS reductase)/FAD synthetase
METINHIGLSGGKDSTALWGWAINESGYPRKSIRGSFCDTENEYPEVYAQIAFLDAYGQKRGVQPVKTLRAHDARWTESQHPLFLALAKWKQRFPSARARFCTEQLKIFPMLKYLEELWLMGFEVVLHSGVRATESEERSRMPEFGEQYHCKIRRPLLTWSINDIWQAHRRYGLPVNPLYFTGRKRVGCKLCCMSNKQDVRITAKTKPETIDLYREWEKIVGNKEATQAQLLPERSRNHVPTFFPATAVPESLRSIKGLVRRRDSKKGKKGETYSACTIDDVVKWSTTLRGGKQMGLDFMFDDSPIFEIDDMHAPCQSGQCE